LGVRRWTLVEYGEPKNILGEIASESNIGLSDLKSCFQIAGERIASSLGIATSPICVESQFVRIVDVAGLIRIAPGVELEIAPKFLGDDKTDRRWREDFFFLASLSKHGKILPSERLSANRTKTRDLPSLVARSIVEMHRDNSRRPLRTYRRVEEFDFAIDGDADPESIVFPTADGFAQTSVCYDRQNLFNGTIKASAVLLQEETTNSSLRLQLGRVSADLGPQKRLRISRHMALPNRARRWQDLYNLSVDTLQGLGLSFDPVRRLQCPGYIVNTWRVWEDFVTIAVRLAFSKDRVEVQRSLDLGQRIRGITGQEQSDNLSRRGRKTIDRD